MTNAALLYLLSSLLILAVAITRRQKGRWTLIISAAVYSLLCFIAYGKLEGFIPAVPLNDIVCQRGFDMRYMRVSIDAVIKAACTMGVIFNIITAIWLYMRWGFWRWVISSVVGFCIVCSASSLFLFISPLQALFGGCCGFMLLVGWTLGLTYIEFCVIGNIWIPILSIIATAAIMMYAALKDERLSMTKKSLITAWGLGQCVTVIVIATHYMLPFKEAFDQCVADLVQIAAHFHTSYVAVNLVIYIIGIVAVLAVNICLTRKCLQK